MFPGNVYADSAPTMWPTGWRGFAAAPTPPHAAACSCRLRVHLGHPISDGDALRRESACQLGGHVLCSRRRLHFSPHPLAPLPRTLGS